MTQLMFMVSEGIPFPTWLSREMTCLHQTLNFWGDLVLTNETETFIQKRANKYEQKKKKLS